MSFLCKLFGHDWDYYEPKGQEKLSARMQVPFCKRCSHDPCGTMVKTHIAILNDDLQRWKRYW